MEHFNGFLTKNLVHLVCFSIWDHQSYCKTRKAPEEEYIFSKFSSCKSISLLKLIFHSSTKTDTLFLFQFFRFTIYENFLRKVQPPQSQLLINQFHIKRVFDAKYFSKICHQNVITNSKKFLLLFIQPIEECLNYNQNYMDIYKWIS